MRLLPSAHSRAIPLLLPLVLVFGSSVALATIDEPRLAELRQLTFGGENAEAYWSPDGRDLVFQSTRSPYECDQMFRISASGGEAQRVSNGTGRTTCGYFSYPAGDRILYASTHQAASTCPPVPDRSQGYVWPIYREYEIWSSLVDGSDARRLTDNAAYDAEATVCPVDGSIIFTSTRDGDLDLYRMNADGSGVRRLTEAPGYDGGAFFSPDCTRIVWRASRPAEGKELDDYRRLLAEDKVRPGELELWVANADGSDARQVTYLNAASFAPSFYPSGDRIIFSSNYGDPAGREFEMWAVDVDGTDLERITHSPGFDGFPVFSPDGKSLAFASNRNQKERGETNVFVAQWVDAPAADHQISAADRFRSDVAWLSDDAREGRGAGTAGLAAAADWIEARFRELGLEPAGEAGGFRQKFRVLVGLRVDPATRVEIDSVALPADAFQPAPYSSSAEVAGEWVAAGYGIRAADLGRDDYAGLDVRGKVVVVRRFTPDGGAFEAPEAQRRHGDIRAKAWAAREAGALALVVVDLPETDTLPQEAPWPTLRADGAQGDAGLPVVFLRREEARRLFETTGKARIIVRLNRDEVEVSNVLARLPAARPKAARDTVVIGAHYDHLGRGGSGSLAPDSSEVHNGADDNASGTAALLLAARNLSERRADLGGDVVFAAFAGEESGLLGSTAYTRTPTAGLKLDRVVAMINMDMVGRLRENELSVLGTDSAVEWETIVGPLCSERGLRCRMSGDGFGPSDQTPFFAAGVPVVHLFTGVHADYHRPSDDVAAINAAGGAQVAALAADLALDLSRREGRLTLRESAPPAPPGDVRASGASLGTVPDYAGPADGRPGLLLAGVRAGGPADQAGLRRGDLIVEIGGKAVREIHDFMYVLQSSKPGDRAVAVVERDGRRIEILVTFGPPTRMR